VDLASYFLEASGEVSAENDAAGHRVAAVSHSAGSAAKHPERGRGGDGAGGTDVPVSQWHDLKSPSDFSKIVGRIRVQTASATLQVGYRGQMRLTRGRGCFGSAFLRDVKACEVYRIFQLAGIL